jgi:hypothetical protein
MNEFDFAILKPPNNVVKAIRTLLKISNNVVYPTGITNHNQPIQPVFTAHPSSPPSSPKPVYSALKSPNICYKGLPNDV